MAWFRDGGARGRASKWAGAQEGRLPGSAPETRGSLPAWKAQHAHAGASQIPPCEEDMPRGGWLQSTSSLAGWQSQAGHTHMGRATTNGLWLPSVCLTPSGS